MAISAETQCSRSRVAGPMPWLWPAQIATDSSMTLAAEKPATPRARSSSRSRTASAASSFSGSKGTRR